LYLRYSAASIAMALSSRFERGWRQRRSDSGRRSSAPMLFAFPPHGRRVRVFHLQPIGRPAACIARAAPLAHDALTTKLAACSNMTRPGASKTWLTRGTFGGGPGEGLAQNCASSTECPLRRDGDLASPAPCLGHYLGDRHFEP
jgi:hypothetical protein